MRVLHVLHTSLPHVCGYSLRSDQIISLQRSMGVEVAVVTSAQQPGNGKDEVIDGVSYTRTQRAEAGRTPLRELRLMRALRQTLTTACEQFAPDIIHAHSPILVGLPAYRAARHYRTPMVYEIRDLWENASVDRGKFAAGSPPYRVARGLETWLLRRADAVFTIGETLRTALAARTPRPVHIAQNGVDIERFVPATATAAWQKEWNPDGRPLLAYLGSFQPYEGIDVLIRAMKRIAAASPTALLLVVGDGAESATLQALVQREGVASHVAFTGRLPHARVKEIYAVADLLVYPRIDTLTTRLTTPLKPLEALAMGKAVLVSDLPAMRELVEPEVSGAAFTPGDPDALARSAVRLLKDPALRQRFGAEGRARVVAQRQWSESVAGYLPIYRQLLQ